MWNYRQINGYLYECPFCFDGVGVGFKNGHYHTRWANKYGRGVRLFCGCGGIVDRDNTTRGKSLQKVRLPK